jgi:DNA-binding NtrC family response regulator
VDEIGLRGLMDVIRPVGASDATVLILGERGVEHDRVARLIHALSPRGTGRFGAVNCAALSAHGLDRELFGTEGRATGGGRPGKIRQTAGGTLFLDEVSEMPLSIQGRLLQFLQEQRVLRPAIGNDVPVDIRLVAASHRDLRTMVAQQGFRGDLYYRLPPAMDALLAHSWPGNVGELENVLERMVVLGTDDWVPAELAATRVDAARRASLKPVSGAGTPRSA